MKSGLCIVLADAIILFFCMGIFIGFLFLFMDLYSSGTLKQSWQSIEVQTSPAFALEQRPAHPFLAEYDYKIKLPSGRKFGLVANTGGRTEFKVYELKNGMLTLEGFDQLYILDIKNDIAYITINSNMYPLCEGMICGWGSGSFSIYKDNISENATYEPAAVKIGFDMENKKLLGEISNGYFKPAERTDNENRQ